MIPTTNDSPYPQLKDGGIIPIPSPLREVLHAGAATDYKLLFQNLRLNLQSRVSGLEDRDLIKLQGKLEYLAEMENFFQSM